MKMYLKSVCVDDQAKALAFYRDLLGFVVKHDIPMGEHRWLSLVSPEDPNGVELLLEPNAHPASKTFQTALKDDGIPFTSFSVTDIEADYQRLITAGVTFTHPPKTADGVTYTTLDDTCGNLIEIVQLG